MQHTEATELHYQPISNPTQFHCHLGLTRNDTLILQSDIFSNPSCLVHITPQVQESNTHSTCVGSISTYDETDDQLLSITNERKQRRMVSNRESARRSRMRKQKQLDELWSQVVYLRNENQQLVDKLNQVLEHHDQALQENVQLKEEASELHQMLTDMQLKSPCPTLRDLDMTPENIFPKTE